MKDVPETLVKLNDQSDGFTVEASIKLDSQHTIHVCPVHTLQAFEPCFWTMEELYRFYDNYGQHQIDEMVSTKNYPLHLTVIRKTETISDTLLETDADVCLVSLDEVIELVENSLE